MLQANTNNMRAVSNFQPIVYKFSYEYKLKSSSKIHFGGRISFFFMPN